MIPVVVVLEDGRNQGEECERALSREVRDGRGGEARPLGPGRAAKGGLLVALLLLSPS